LHFVTFVFGIIDYQGFETPIAAASGLTRMPKHSEIYIGGHALMAVGYDDQTQAFLVRNSWSSSGAIDGYCWITYYLTNPHLISDLWAVRALASKQASNDSTPRRVSAPLYVYAAYCLSGHLIN
jgi:hypothetical protein